MGKDRNPEVQMDDREDLVPLESERREAENHDLRSQSPSSEPGAGDPRDQMLRLQAERDALFERLARQQAEFENLRKRSAREQADFREYAAADTVKAFIPVLDSLDLALKSKSGGVEGELRKGVELIRKQLDEVLAKLGVQAVPAVGTPFDPRFHEAIETVESAEAKDNEVVDELQRGYKMKERLLRPAMVRVAKNIKK